MSFIYINQACVLEMLFFTKVNYNVFIFVEIKFGLLFIFLIPTNINLTFIYL